ncbi:hypothetical protein M3Y97_00985600 [Aphelenchoides bicaudatus]|nr:hypothetical protein M3Y97_00985600 [Aphelenchoides bicaudatus]
MQPPDDNTYSCSFVSLEATSWPLAKIMLVVLEVIVLVFVFGLLPKLFKDLLNSGRLPIYMKVLITLFLGGQWLSECLRLALLETALKTSSNFRIVQVLITRPEVFRPYLPFYVHTFLCREALVYAEYVSLTLSLCFLHGEVNSFNFRQKVKKGWIAFPICILVIFASTLIVVILYLIDVTLENMFVTKFVVLLLFFWFNFRVSGKIEVVAKNRGNKRDYLVNMQRSYRRAVRGSRYMRLQLRILFLAFILNSFFSFFAYYWALTKCSALWLQMCIQVIEFCNALLFVMSLFNCSHYMGGKIHRIVAKIIPSQKLGSTASTEPLYYNTELMNPQEAHFRQLAQMWSTSSSAYPQYYTPVTYSSTVSL